MAGRVQVWAGAGVTVLAVTGLSVYFATVGLENADKLASVVGALVAVAGLAVAVYGLAAPSAVSRQVSQRATASGYGRVTQIGGHQVPANGPTVGAAPDRMAQHGTASEGGSVTQIGGDQNPDPSTQP
ncbi:hypothetical protein [Sphaerisporangium corydalis]|uniref:Uncharacterized protein n=1 Tax=Sphaerisporangium corydalis TaxID=1441875 RepID=A0ABV9EV21_9ACTN|nr:hypothetical protein [Sphaerisporangium corydalis]